jgi:hypothetical protein
MASANGEDDEVRISVGTYLANPGFAYFSDGTDALVVSGGWILSCSSRVFGSKSTLDGDHHFAIMNLISATGDITVTDLEFVDGSIAGGGNDGAGLYVSTDGEALIERNAFYLNEGINLAGGLYAGTNAGTLNMRNNVFLGNAAASAGAGELIANGAQAFVTGNTVVANSATSPDGDGNGGFYLGGEAHFTVANNLLWNNGAFDLRNQTLAATFLHNDYAHLLGQEPGPHSSGNLDMEPDFAPGLLNLHLAPASPLVNAGEDAAPGGLGARDAAGVIRLQGAHVDIGAYETDVLFVGGFEALPIATSTGRRPVSR